MNPSCASTLAHSTLKHDARWVRRAKGETCAKIRITNLGTSHRKHCVSSNDLLLDRQAMPLHTPCPGLNFVYFPIPVAQVAPPFDQPVNLVLVLSKKTDQPAPEVWQTT